jgi:UDP-2,3-diacylglucosamine hydrolase
VITTVREERLAVVSDVHLGNPSFRARRPFLEFLRFAFENGASVCINGDGVDMMHVSLRRLSKDLATCSGRFVSFARAGLRVYYVVGNHDVVLEHFLSDWGVVNVVPFLNVVSGDQRIRIEHGHLYDDLYLGYPHIYGMVTWVGGMALRIHPAAFRVFSRSCGMLGALADIPKKLRRGAAAPRERPVHGERPCYFDAAEEIANRGFDAVVFGHTHRPGETDLGDGRRYFNTGAWLNDPHYLQIDAGVMRLRPVFGSYEAAIPGTWARSPRGSWMRQTRDMATSHREWRA